MKYREEIRDRYDATGLRGLLAAHPEDILEVPAPADEKLQDMDVPEDYHRLAATFTRSGN